MVSATLLRFAARVVGDQGTMDVFNPAMPQLHHHLTVKTRSGKRRERVDRVPTYTYQLRAFAGAVLRNQPIPTEAEDAVKNMRVIDAVYRAAGLPLRAGPALSPAGGERAQQAGSSAQGKL
jgi:predicted dehydrogenase